MISARLASLGVHNRAEIPVLEPMQLTGYPEEQLPTPERAATDFSTPSRGELDHGCAQAQDVAREHP